MLNKNTTSSGILVLFGLSPLGLDSSNDVDNDISNISRENLYAQEVQYNTPESIKSRVDSYVENKYSVKDNLTNKYTSLEPSFFDVVQKFSENQIKLDPDFTEALDELLFSKLNSKPHKKRF